VVTYGIDSAATVSAASIRADNGGSSFDVVQGGGTLGRVQLNVPGKHNVRNALAAVVSGLELGIAFDKIAEGLAVFDGVGRRLELKGETQGITVIDDYGHHPTEIRATLAALRERYPGRRLVAVFQPHRYTRTQSLQEEFSKCFADADQVYVMDIYPAGEAPIPGVTAESILKPLQKNHRAAAALPGSTTLEAFRDQLKPGDVVLTLGAGDVWKWGDQLLQLPAAHS
jgi:UDP-N-acetylmuramate--alanine ligase